MTRTHRLAPILKRRIATLGVLATGVVMAWALPAQATVIQKERDAGTETADVDLCRLAVHEVFAFSVTRHVRVGKHDLATAFFAHDNFRFTDTLTNTANGKFFVIEAKGVFRDVKATRVEGTIFRFTSVESGAVRTVRDMNGNVILRDRGSIRTTYLFDTLGDNTPGGLFVELISERVSGPHPLFEMDEATFCTLVQGLIG